MNIDLNKYIANVLRNEVASEPQPDAKAHEMSPNLSPSNSAQERFILASKYSLRLDEIA